MSRIRALCACIVAASSTLLGGMAWAAAGTPVPDSLKVDYFANAGEACDATVRITDPGTNFANMCADIYVFDQDEEMKECCSCPVTRDDLRTLSVNVDLTSNPANGIVPKAGTIMILSAAQTSHTCPMPDGHPASGGVVPNLFPADRVWATHVQNNGTLTETPSSDATLSQTELDELQQQCYAIALVGSGSGICTCGTGS